MIRGIIPRPITVGAIFESPGEPDEPQHVNPNTPLDTGLSLSLRPVEQPAADNRPRAGELQDVLRDIYAFGRRNGFKAVSKKAPPSFASPSPLDRNASGRTPRTHQTGMASPSPLENVKKHF